MKKLKIIHEPQWVRQAGNRQFVVDENCQIAVDQRNMFAARLLVEKIKKSTGKKISVVSNKEKNRDKKTIVLVQIIQLTIPIYSFRGCPKKTV